MRKGERSAISWVFEFAGPKKRVYIGSILTAIVGVLFGIAPYFVMADIIFQLYNKEGSLRELLLECLIMAVLWLGRVACHAVSTALSHKATFFVLGSIRKRCLEKLSRISLGRVQSRTSGELKNILCERIDSIETTLAHIFPEFTSNLLGSLAVLIYLFCLDWRMALIALITLPIGLFFVSLTQIGYEKYYGRTVKAVKALNDTAVEYIGGIDVIKVFGKTKSSYERFTAAAKEGANSYIDWMRVNNLPFCFAMVITPATLVSVLPLGAMLVKNGTLLPETFILCLILSIGLVAPLIICMSYSDDLAKLNTIIGEVTSILKEEDIERPKKDIEQPKNYDVEFKNVRFSYDEKEVIHGINLKFQEGKVTALVGPSGSGKSTLAKLLNSYWDVKEGAITIGGVDIKNLSLENYYKNIAYVSQDNFLFDDTVMENIRMGNLDATDEEVIEAAKKCGCHDFIMSLENGYKTEVGSAGGHLSGGERQRISIARAMLKNAPIIVLDEATAYTDPENEAIIQQSVASLTKGKTLIVIAHRLSTICDADKICVINGGKLEAEGTQEELLKNCPLYKKMWESHISAKDSLEGGIKNV